MNHDIYYRWRPAIAAFAILLTVVGVAVVSREHGESSNSGNSNPDVVVESSTAPLITVPLTRTLESGMKG
ncbi:MAG: hypothetical protein ACYC0U_06230, partial [Ilumatobacteraceae bacterium]